MPLTPDWGLSSPLSMLWSALIVAGWILIGIGIILSGKSLAWLLILLPLGIVALIAIGIVWWGDFIIWMWGKRAIWAGANHGVTFQVYGWGPNDSCGLDPCHGVIVPHLGGASIDESTIGTILVILLAFGLVFLPVYILGKRGRH